MQWLKDALQRRFEWMNHRPRSRAAAILIMMLMVAGMLPAQSTTASLNGTVVDASGALVTDAQTSAVNERTGLRRSTKTNGSGRFVFAALPSGDYDITVQKQGFKANVVNGVHLDPADNKSLVKIELQVGDQTESVVVTAGDIGMIDTSTGEKSTLITASDINKLSVEGRDVSELVKMLPGFAIAQTSNSIDNSSYDPSQVNVSGALRSYAANGNSANGVTMLSDGANISDPGNYGDSVQNVNSDMVDEVKVQTSNFTAETSNGPVVVNAVGKSGSQAFHGGVYVYGRTYQLNSQDWLSKYEAQQKPADRYVYPGGNLSGPLLIPGTKFNHNRKITFFVGGEDYAQRNIYAYGGASQATAKALVPTKNMRSGDFSCAELQTYLGAQAIACNANGTSTILNSNFNNIGSVPTTAPNGNTLFGTITAIDSSAAAIVNMLPLPNRANQGDGYNYVTTNLVNDNLYQLRARTDYSATDNLKIFATYNAEMGKNGVPEVPYYSPAQTAPLGGVNTPGGGLLSTINSQTAGLNAILILSPRMTNETIANLTYMHQEFTPKNESALLSSTVGYTYQGIYNNHSLQYPQLHDYGDDGLPLGLFPDFSISSPYATKFLPSFADNVTYLWKTHTFKAGVYVQQVTNNQRLMPSNSSTNGQLADYYYGATYTDPDGAQVYSSGNYAANFLEGQIEQFSQQNYVPVQDLYFWNVNWYATDSWKVNERLSLDLGMRFEHLGAWQDRHGVGIAVFDPSLLSSGVFEAGFTWHGRDNNIPNSGVPTRFAFYEPRVGFSWNAYGNGKTTLRGGWGMYRNHDNWNVVQQAAALAQGVQVTAISGGAGISLSKLKEVGTLGDSSAGAGNFTSGASTTAYALQKGDSQQPLTQTYSLTLDQQLPHNMQIEIGYSGNHGQNLTAQNVNNLNLTLQNVNPVPLGAFFQPDPQTGAVVPLNLISGMSAQQVDDYRPYYTPALKGNQYGAIDIPRHILYSNYNALQTSWNKQSGHLTYGVNYTWSKALGIRDGYYNGNAADATNLRNNYGPLSFDRSQIFNASYTYDFGNLVHGAGMLPKFANGWQISGITGYQSGPNLQATYYSNFNLQGKLGSPTLGTQLNVASNTFLGTPDVQLQPVLTCNPAHHTTAHQYVNGNCFQLPQIGSNGPFNMPYLHGPAFFNSDLTVVRNISLAEKKSLQIRFAAFNFINHPLTSFSTSFPQQIALNLSNLAAGGETQSPALATPAAGFGVSTIREGRRVSEVAIKYNF
jgi:hypothetical protein